MNFLWFNSHHGWENLFLIILAGHAKLTIKHENNIIKAGYGPEMVIDVYVNGHWSGVTPEPAPLLSGVRSVNGCRAITGDVLLLLCVG